MRVVNWPPGLHNTNHYAYRSYGDAFEHPFNVVSCTSIRLCWPRSCGNYASGLQNWISSCSEEHTLRLEKLPNQICSRPVECNASCLVNLRTWKHLKRKENPNWYRHYLYILMKFLISTYWALIRNFMIAHNSCWIILGLYYICAYHTLRGSPNLPSNLHLAP